MDYLDELIASRLKTELAPRKVATVMISKKLAELGVTLTDEQLEKLESDLDLDQLDTVDIDLNDEQMTKLEPHRDSKTGKITIRFDDQDVKSFGDKVEIAIADLIPKILTTSSEALLRAWKSQADKIFEEQRVVRFQFEKNVREIWGKAIDLLEMLHGVCLDTGSGFNQQFRPKAAEDSDVVFEVLTRLHARSCQIGSEILVLLKNGFADGAIARWRTLHEIAVIGMFISKHGNDVAERYLAHSVVTDYKDAIQYKCHCRALGFEPLTEDELNTLASDKDEVCKRYGANFKEEYGWASNTLNNAMPRFTDIEQDVNLQHFRPFYKLANINVHAGSKGATYRLGLPTIESDLLVAGPSLYGLSEPGQNAAISINQVTATLLLTIPNLDRLAFLTATQELVREVFDEFALANDRLEQRAAG